MRSLFRKRKPEAPQESAPAQKSLPRRVLVVTEHEGWPAGGPKVVGWDQLNDVQNLRDFDDVLIDLSEPPIGRVSLGETPSIGRIEVADERSQAVWRSFDVLFSRDAVSDFLAQGGRFAFLGRADFLRPRRLGTGDFGGGQTDFTSILKIGFEWESAAGARYEVQEAAEDRGLATYLADLGEYEIAVTKIEPYVRRDGYGRPTEAPPPLEKKTYAVTRAGKPIAFSILWQDSGAEATFIPLPKRNRREAVREILKRFLGVDLSDESPPWVADVRVAEEDALDDREREISAQMNMLRQNMANLMEERRSARLATELLYASGKPLELAVIAALEELGSEVERPTDPNKEDGWITVRVGVRTFQGVLEIKSTENEHFGAKGVRQLGEWVQRGVKNRGIQYKPIFIGSSLIREPIERRPHPFVVDVVKTASQFDAVLVRGEDLFEALMAHRRGKLDRDGFWTEMFACVGPFDVLRHIH